MASVTTSLAMVLIVLASLSYSLPSSHADIDFITRTCKKTSNAALCVAVLSADPESGQFFTEHDLASTTLKIVTDTIKKNAEVIKNLGDKYRGTLEGSMWDVCVMVHDIAAGQLEIDARPSFNRGDYAYASDVVSVVKGVGDACENAFKEVQRKSPLTDMDRQTTERCGVAIDLIGLLITNSK